MPDSGKVLVMSGSLAAQLSKYVDEKADDNPLWISCFDTTNPETVKKAHLDFLQNGAQTIKTNTYQASVDGYMKHLKVSRQKAIELIRNSVKLVKEAKKEYLKTAAAPMGLGLPLVIAAIGPYGAYLHDFSEYSGDYADKVTLKELQEWHRPRIDAILAEGVDWLGFETIPCQLEAQAIVELMLTDYKNVKFYMSFQCKNGKTLAHGEEFNDVVAMAWGKLKEESATERCIGIGVNCCNPRNVAKLFKSLHPSEKGVVPLLVYSNRDEIYNTQLGEWQFNEDTRSLDTFVPEWVELGVRTIGGCCGVYPEDIAQIRNCVDELNAKSA